MKPNKNLWYWILILGFIHPVICKAQQDTVFLTLEQAIGIAQAQSPDAIIAKHRFRISYWQYRSFTADYRPSIRLDAIMPNISNSFRTVSVPAGPDVYQYNSLANYDVNMTINQKIGFTGGSIFLQSSLSRLDNYFNDTSTTSYQSTPIIIGYRQPIFQYNEYRWSKKIEPIKYEKAKRQYLEDVETVAQTTNNHFFNLLIAKVEKDIAIKNMHNYDTLYKIAKGRYQLGKIAENELLQLDNVVLFHSSQ